MLIRRRGTLAGPALAAVCLFAIPNAAQGTYPERPIRVIVPFAAGSASDVVARIVLEKMAEDLGHRLLVDNQAGASGNLGTAAVARAASDGYTILVSASGPLAVNQALFSNIGYDPLKDFEPISLIATLPNIIVVNASQPLRSVSDLIDAAKKNPGQLNYGSIGNGSSQHLAAAYFEQVTGTRMTHVPYRVTGQLVSDLVAGQLQVSFQLIPNVLGQIQGGRLRPLAITASKRSEVLPQVPTVGEVGVSGYEAYGWFAMLAPKNTPQPVIKRLHAAYMKAMSDATTRRRVVEVGAEPATSTPAELRTFMQTEANKWRDIIRTNNIKAD